MYRAGNLVASTLLVLFFIIAITSSWNDSLIFDEPAHIGAGYSYLTQKDSRLNPEHPPLMKDLAALPLLFLNLAFPTNTDAWQHQVNGQWDQGGLLIFRSGNNADAITHASRIPIMLLAVLLGALLYLWVRRTYGTKIALLTLFFYTFSPTIIAHSRFVTTDIAAALGFFIGITSFVRFLARPTAKRLIIAGVMFGIAQLLKFSLFLLIPIYLFLTFMWLLSNREKLFSKNSLKFFGKIFLIFVIGGIVIWIFYTWHVWNYPQAKQLSDAHSLIDTFKVHFFVDLDYWLIEHQFTRPLGQYLLGVMMVTQRTAGGNSAYFMGEVSSNGWLYYFPTLYILKESLGFLLLLVVSVLLALRRILQIQKKSWQLLRDWIKNNFTLFASLFFIAFYWVLSIFNPLNIGLRHVLPTFPFIYFLVSRELALWISKPISFENKTLVGYLATIYHAFITPIPKIFFVALACLWIALNTFINFPYYLSYYNELAGGTENGYWYATDSNYDWGQDLKRLGDFVRSHPNQKIYLDYFGDSGGGARDYYLGTQYQDWGSWKGLPPPGSLFAVSINSLAGSQAKPVGGFPPQKPEDTYSWLKNLTPLTRVGTSILIYQIP